MCEVCIQNFLHRSDPACVERHSDSSDFESSSPIPVVTPKCGNHSLLTGRLKNSKSAKEYKNKQSQINRLKSFDPGQKSKYIVEQSQSTKTYHKKCVPYADHKSISLKTNTNIEKFTRKDDKRNRGDQSVTCYLEQNYSTRSLVKNKILPCLSQILKRSNNNCYKHLTSIKEKDSLDIHGNTNLACVIDNRNKSNKCKRRRQKYPVQPVYTVKDINGFPLISNQTYDRVTPPQYKALNKINSVCHSATSTTTTEEEIKRNYNYETLVQKFENRTQKDLKKRDVKYNDIKKYDSTVIHYNKEQQCSSKLLSRSPYQVFTSSCQVKSSLNDAEALAKLESNSSAFWSFLAEKVNKKNPTQKILPNLPKACDCEKPNLPCSPDTCKNLDTCTETEFYGQFLPPQQPPPALSINIPAKPSKVIKKKEEEKVECKCYPEKKQQPIKETKSLSSNDSKPCQESHDDIIKAVAAKYKGEILCIHNPPCILINGCLNMPPPKTTTQANFWPVTHNKKSSFVQMCKKIKRKQRACDQSSQHHEMISELEQYLPEFRTEKIIQSICNHNPPCQVVHGCYKPRYDPKLANSCVHVPMCEKVPECVMDRKNDVNTKMCQHTPKCAELPICSRKYIVLTAKESTSTQVYPATRMICRHNPPCLRLPKCLTQWICSGHVPWDIIPGCSHHPCCEQIPACCTKSARDMVSVTSQYPTAPCRIV